MAGQQSHNNYLEAFQERLTNYLANIGSDHAYIHKGKAFTAVIDVGTISAVYYIGFRTPSVADDKHVHWRPASLTTSTDYVLMKMHEGDTFTGGTDVVPINRNRNIATSTAMASFKKGVTSTPTGTMLSIMGFGTSGVPAASAGGTGGADHELLLEPDTDYVISLTPSGATDVTMELFWYDEPGFSS